MKASRQRLFILTLLFIVTAINYMDRANIALAHVFFMVVRLFCGVFLPL